MMEIEIAQPDRMSQSGSSLLRLIQNVNMPILDLLVRESIQNSLDAALDNSDFIEVEFLTGKFTPMNLCRYLDQEVGSKLLIKSLKWPEIKEEYLAIRDFHTQGLSGPLNYDEVKNGEYGNLLKLIYEISKPQEKEGSGGSWGLGKTIYFRVGIGLVFYYSRIQVNGSFQSRLAATLVENEKDPNSLLYNKDKNILRGIAWWGKRTGQNRTEPLTNEKEIEEILSVFGISPYVGKETGTTIIIPFIDSQKLLTDNFKEETVEEQQAYKPYWMDSLQEYLEIAVQRWYAPRLNNPHYPYGKFLKVAINSKFLDRSQMAPAFLLIQNLYNKANNQPVYNLEEENRIVVENISLRNEMTKGLSGKLAFILANREMLKMTPPDNFLPPNLYYGCVMSDSTENRPIIAFVRKPGMIVAYEESGKWIDKIPNTENDQYLIALFVLNSQNTLKKRPDITVEEYVRQSETADHTSWSDYTFQGITPSIVSKTQKQITTKLTNVIKPKKDSETERKNTGYGKLLGEILLPPQDFGKQSSSIPQPFSQRNSTKIIGYKQGISLKFKLDQTEYLAHGMIIYADLMGTQEFRRCVLELLVETDSDNIKLWNWEDKLGTKIPFYLNEVTMTIFESKKKRQMLDVFSLNQEKTHYKSADFELYLEKNSQGYCCGLALSKQESGSFYIEASFEIHLNSRDFRPTLHFTKEN